MAVTIVAEAVIAETINVTLDSVGIVKLEEDGQVIFLTIDNVAAIARLVNGAAGPL